VIVENGGCRGRGPPSRQLSLAVDEERGSDCLPRFSPPARYGHKLHRQTQFLRQAANLRNPPRRLAAWAPSSTPGRQELLARTE